MRMHLEGVKNASPAAVPASIMVEIAITMATSASTNIYVAIPAITPKNVC